MRARQRDLGALGRAAHLEYVGANPVSRVVALAEDLLPLRQDRLGLADLEDHVALLDPVHDAAQDLTFLTRELRVDALALGVAHFLEDHLLGRLGRDPPKVLRRPLLLQLELVVELRVRVQRLGVGEADLLLVVGDLRDHLLPAVHPEIATLAVREEGRLQRLEEDLLVDPLLAPHLLDNGDQLSVHRFLDSPRFYALRAQGTSASNRAFVTSLRRSSVRSPSRSSTSRSGPTSARRP